ncbi:MAG TPA: hypothetical protein VGZ27_07120 [Vicinamibacterales bacterium]|jgi:hypothetical protein|nr:hypothetical protein [Vicinamibacterales bacterium]
MTSIRTIAIGVFFLYGLLVAPSIASAQYGATPFRDPATGEVYHIEGGLELWNPPPQLQVASESLGIVGSTIDAAKDLGVMQQRIVEWRLVIRPGRKHKFRVNYLPMHYMAQSTVHTDFVFNGIHYGINLPVSTDLTWNTWLLGYEYDFLYHDRWFVGFVAQVKETDVEVKLTSPIPPPDFVVAKAPIPNLGGIVRVYVVPNISVTGELVGIKIPNSLSTTYRAHYVDFDLYGTVNFTNHAGVQVGYRRIDVGYLINKDSGAFLMKGLYFGGVVRY